MCPSYVLLYEVLCVTNVRFIESLLYKSKSKVYSIRVVVEQFCNVIIRYNDDNGLRKLTSKPST